MFKFVLCLVVICFVASAFSQTFQYSHGWTNGKRSPNAYINYETPEVYGNAQYYDRQLERCSLQLQNLLGSERLTRVDAPAISPQTNGNNK